MLGGKNIILDGGGTGVVDGVGQVEYSCSYFEDNTDATSLLQPWYDAL